MAIATAPTTEYGHEIIRPTPSRVRPVSYDDMLARCGAWKPQKARALRCREGGYIWDRLIRLIDAERVRLDIPDDETVESWMYEMVRWYVDEVIDGDYLPSEAARLAGQRLRLRWAYEATRREHERIERGG